MGKCRHIFSRVEQQCTTTVIFLSNPPQRTVSMPYYHHIADRARALYGSCFFFDTYFKQESRRNVSHMCRQVMH